MDLAEEFQEFVIFPTPAVSVKAEEGECKQTVNQMKMVIAVDDVQREERSILQRRRHKRRNAILEAINNDRKMYQEKRMKIELEKLELMKKRNELMKERNRILKEGNVHKCKFNASVDTD